MAGPEDNLGQKPKPLQAETWLNSDEPIDFNRLEGKVVLLKFWSFGCSDCRNSMKQINSWLEQYRQDGLTAVSVHTPELEFEKNLENLKKAIQDLKIEFPVAIDNDYLNFKAYHNSIIPTLYLIGRDGIISDVAQGPYQPQKLENMLETLLNTSNQQL